ncbi:purine-nucleoside phosphorylase [Iocasia frigidifontis]|uniref:Purine nucleoside phosphorylase n=1 Tax=Iocasia fonsfrigidae TaxID=2682810 RepID=A0A8A7KFL1_9FIRM|nr:purine-nucleoside phosphorylase [Iocasia fonsfrigidae]QTL98488.1 purine-nucleoside phosphorylase [Iocasia fonsfrigidae]
MKYSSMRITEIIKQKLTEKPQIGLILGSGLGKLANEIEEQRVFKYQDIPDFPVSTVPGHAGRLIAGRLEGKAVIAMQGRFHFYEGYTMKQIILPVLVMKLLGIETLIVTNAAGGVNKDFNPGEFMLISDHINMMGTNPLIGQNFEEFGPRFPDMSEAYNKGLLKLARETAEQLGITAREGVYAAVTGPSFETPAEIRFFANNGVDAVGMSTVPEVIAARHMSVNVLGISCITNMAAGILDQPLSHEEVIETTEKVKENFVSLIKGITAVL